MSGPKYMLPDAVVVTSSNNFNKAACIKDIFCNLGKGQHYPKDTFVLSPGGMTRIRGVHVIDADDVVYEIGTLYRIITCPGGTMLPVIRDSKELVIAASEIRQGDCLIPVHNCTSWADINSEDTGEVISIAKSRYKGKGYCIVADGKLVVNNLVVCDATI